MKNIYPKGQATLLAILIITTVAIVTAVGVTTRQNAALKRTSYTKQTDQGFACANSGVDIALLCIKNNESGDPTSACSANGVSLGGGAGCSYNYTVSANRPVSSVLTYPAVQKDTVLQLNTASVNNLGISWTGEAYLEISHIYYNGADYKMDKYLVYRRGSSAPEDVEVSGFSEWDGSGFYNLSNFIDASQSIVRIHPYFADALNVSVTSSDSTFNNISQGYKINATGTAGSVVRNLEVIRTEPQLPAIFDYVLYSEEGSITK